MNFVKKGILEVQLSKKPTVKYADGTQSDDFSEKPAEPDTKPEILTNLMQKKEEKVNPKTLIESRVRDFTSKLEQNQHDSAMPAFFGKQAKAKGPQNQTPAISETDRMTEAERFKHEQEQSLIKSNSLGYKMLQKMAGGDFEAGKGLGKDGTGIVEPIKAVRKSNLGDGTSSSSMADEVHNKKIFGKSKERQVQLDREAEVLKNVRKWQKGYKKPEKRPPKNDVFKEVINIDDDKIIFEESPGEDDSQTMWESFVGKKKLKLQEKEARDKVDKQAFKVVDMRFAEDFAHGLGARRGAEVSGFDYTRKSVLQLSRGGKGMGFLMNRLRSDLERQKTVLSHNRSSYTAKSNNHLLKEHEKSKLSEEIEQIEDRSEELAVVKKRVSNIRRLLESENYPKLIKELTKFFTSQISGFFELNGRMIIYKCMVEFSGKKFRSSKEIFDPAALETFLGFLELARNSFFAKKNLDRQKERTTSGGASAFMKSQTTDMLIYDENVGEFELLGWENELTQELSYILN